MPSCLFYSVSFTWLFSPCSREFYQRISPQVFSFLIKEYPQLKYFNTRPPEPEIYKYMNYNVKTDKRQVWFSSRTKFNTLSELVDYCMENKADGVATKLTNICLIPNPHADPTFEFHNKDHDSLRVPISELELGKSK